MTLEELRDKLLDARTKGGLTSHLINECLRAAEQRGIERGQTLNADNSLDAIEAQLKNKAANPVLTTLKPLSDAKATFSKPEDNESETPKGLVSQPKVHASDCAVHNMPAYPNGPCDCGLEPKPGSDLGLREALEAGKRCANYATGNTMGFEADRSMIEDALTALAQPASGGETS